MDFASRSFLCQKQNKTKPKFGESDHCAAEQQVNKTER